MKRYKKALVTGGAGFIGSHVVEELVLRGIETISIDNYSAGKADNIKHLKGYRNFTELNCDVLDYERLSDIMSGVDVVFHQAASKKTVCLKDPRKDLDVNGKGTFNMLELAVKHGVKKFVHASTGSVYGEPLYFPQDESHPLNPTSYYGVSKLAGDRYVAAFSRLYGLDTTILRYFHVYGPRQESSDVGGVVSIFARNIIKGEPIRIHGDGTQIRSFTYVKDVVKANIAAAAVVTISGEAYNCASALKISIKDLYNCICKFMGVTDYPLEFDEWVAGDIKHFDINNMKIRKALGIEFMTDFDWGIKETLDWAKSAMSR